jgi:hypothetical protein
MLTSSCHGWRPRCGQDEGHCSGGNRPFKRGHNIGWKAFGDSNPDWSCLKLGLMVKLSHSGEATMPGKSAGHASSLRVPPWHLPYKWGKKQEKNTSQGSQKVPVGHESVCQHGHLLAGSHNKFVNSGIPSDASEDVSTLSQHRYLPRGSSSPKFESNLVVKALMWSAKNATPKSSRICLLQMYQGEMEAMLRQLDWDTKPQILSCYFITIGLVTW